MATPQKKGQDLAGSATDGGKATPSKFDGGKATPFKFDGGRNTPSKVDGGTDTPSKIPSAKSTPIKSPPCKKVKGAGQVANQQPIPEQHEQAEMQVETWQCSPHETFYWKKITCTHQYIEKSGAVKNRSEHRSMPSRELTYPTWGKGTSSSTVILMGYVSSQEGMIKHDLTLHYLEPKDEVAKETSANGDVVMEDQPKGVMVW